jgi:hypothetical protein
MLTQRILPDGTKIEDYHEWQSWSYRDLAWQYLRRNEEFQKSCTPQTSTAPLDDEEKQNIADNFFLKKFKHFHEEKLKKNEGFSAIVTKSKKIDDPNGENFSFHLKSHEIAFVLDLRVALRSKEGIDAQLKIIKKILERRSTELKKSHTAPIHTSSPKVTRETHLHRLRIFDLHNSGKTWKEIAQIPGIGQKNIPIDSMIERLRKDRDAARQLIDFGYIALVTSARSREIMPLSQA